jgi:hypothetical protein
MENINTRVQVFTSEFLVKFEELLREEVARSNVTAMCRVPGVLVARGLVGPVLVAFCKALRSALSVRRTQSLAVRASVEISPVSAVSHYAD